ncbi:MAG: lasso peptide biosynthesis B2 protein [Ilumatobacteraceae bacterium]
MPIVRAATRARWVNRILLVEAVLVLHLTAALQKWVPMPRWVALLGRPATVPSAWRGREVGAIPIAWADVREARAGRAVARGVRILPWEPSCLAQAATAQLLLRQRGAAGVVVIGLRPSGETDDGSWSAHAWLLGGRGALTGGPAAAGFTATTVFEVPGRLTADRVSADLAMIATTSPDHSTAED